MNKQAGKKTVEPVRDLHSYARPDQVRVKHAALDLDVKFDRKTLEGTATLTIERTDAAAPLIVDSRDLNIGAVEVSPDGKAFAATAFQTALCAPGLLAEFPRAKLCDQQQTRSNEDH
jgi:aminopeptidase N